MKGVPYNQAEKPREIQHQETALKMGVPDLTEKSKKKRGEGGRVREGHGGHLAHKEEALIRLRKGRTGRLPKRKGKLSFGTRVLHRVRGYF